MIEKFNSLLKEYNDIISNSGRDTFDLRENHYRFSEVETGLSDESYTIKLDLEFANDLSDKIKLTHPNFKSDRLLEYNNFFISNKLNRGAPWPPKGNK